MYPHFQNAVGTLILTEIVTKVHTTNKPINYITILFTSHSLFQILATWPSFIKKQFFFLKVELHLHPSQLHHFGLTLWHYAKGDVTSLTVLRNSISHYKEKKEPLLPTTPTFTPYSSKYSADLSSSLKKNLILGRSEI